MAAFIFTAGAEASIGLLFLKRNVYIKLRKYYKKLLLNITKYYVILLKILQFMKNSAIKTIFFILTSKHKIESLQKNYIINFLKSNSSNVEMLNDCDRIKKLFNSIDVTRSAENSDKKNN